MKRILCLLAILCCTSGCGDDGDGTTPVDPFDVTIRAVDPLGNPVADLELGMCSDNPFMQDLQDKAAVSIGFEAAAVAHVLVTIEDIEGTTLRTLYDDALPSSGTYRLLWNGQDEQGVELPSGRYTVRLLATDGAETVFTDTRDMLMCLAIPSQYVVGTTDAAGEIVLDDARHFPHLFTNEHLAAYDENGQQIGWIEFDGVMRLELREPLAGDHMVFRELVVGDDAVVVLVWDPVHGALDKPRDKALPPAAAAAIPDPEWRLSAPYPNPFN